MPSKSQEVLPVIVDRLGLKHTDWLFQDLLKRTAKGVETYGCTLHTHNGRNAAQDALEEAEDMLQYVAQAVIEGGCNLEPIRCVIERTLELMDAP